MVPDVIKIIKASNFLRHTTAEALEGKIENVDRDALDKFINRLGNVLEKAKINEIDNDKLARYLDLMALQVNLTNQRFTDICYYAELLAKYLEVVDTINLSNIDVLTYGSKLISDSLNIPMDSIIYAEAAIVGLEGDKTLADVYVENLRLIGVEMDLHDEKHYVSILAIKFLLAYTLIFNN